MIATREILHAHLFCGLGGGARGFNQGEARLGNMHARFRCLGGIDVDPACIRDFERLSGVAGTVLDLFSREQYTAFHGKEPPAWWREAAPVDIHRAFGFERPHIIFLSAPCKGFSGLLSEGKSQSAKYQALNGLTLRGVWLTLEAYKDDLPELLVFENVPRIATRGRHLLDQIVSLMRSYGYAVAETTHDCGHLGGLAQSRKRFLLVARHAEKMPSFLYEPQKRPLRAVGDVLGRMLLPGHPAAGPMHRVPNLQWKTWVRLAFVEAGSDWRSLNRLAVENGFLRDYGIMPERVWQDGTLPVADPRRIGDGFGKYVVTSYCSPSGTVIAGSTTGQGAFAVADPHYSGDHHNNVYRVVNFGSHAGTITSGGHPSSGGQGVADPRPEWMHKARETGEAYENIYRIVPFDEHCKAVTGASHTAGGALSVADPRMAQTFKGKMTVSDFENPSGTVLSNSNSGQGAYAVADPRTSWGESRKSYGNMHYGVIPWDSHSLAVPAAACHDNGFGSVADPRLPEASQNCLAVIRALDGTWHRPFTTLELAALQGLLDPEETLELDGLSDSAWRERIGNAVPPPAAKAIAGVMGQVLLLTWAGETFSMSSTPIWVQPVIAGLMAAREGM